MAKDNTVRFNGPTIQLLPGLDRLSYAQARVEVQERLDGSVVVSYQGGVLASRETPPNPAVLRARKATRSGPVGPSVGVSAAAVNPDQEGTHPKTGSNGHKPGPHHSWKRYPAVTKSQNY